MGKQIQTKSFPILGGLRTDRPLTAYDEPDSVIAKNCRLDGFSAVGSRLGGTKYNTTQLAGGGDVLGLFDFKYGAAGQKFLVAENTVLYTDDGTTQTSIKAGQTAAYYYIFESFDDFAWIVNGKDTMLKYDGTTVTNASIAKPVVGTFATAVNAAAGNLNGSYQYLITFYVTATGQESQPFTLAGSPVAITPANEQADLTNIPVSVDTQVTARRVYRTTAGGSILNAQFVAAIADNTTTTYTDNIADGSLGALINLDRDAAPDFSKIVEHKNRCFGIGDANNPSRLYFSVLYNFWYWPQGLVDVSLDKKLFYIDIKPDDGDQIINIIKYYEYLIIFKKNSIYILEGFDETDFIVRQIEYEQRVGCISKRAAVVADNWCYFLDRNGIYRTNGQAIQYADVGEKVEAYFDPNNPTATEKVNPAQLQNAVAIVDNKQPNKLIRFSIPTGSETKNNVTIIHDYLSNQWHQDTGYYAQSYAIRDSSNLDYLMRGDNYGYTWTEETQEGDGGLISSTATATGASTLTDTAQAMTVNIYKGTYIEMTDGSNAGERVLIVSNTATEFTITGTWTVTPAIGDSYIVGGIDFDYVHKWDNYGNPAITKRLNYILPRLDTSGDYSVTTKFLFDFQIEASESSSVSLSPETLWDDGLWDVGIWDSPSISQGLIRPPADNVHRWSAFGVAHKTPAEPVTLNGYDKFFQAKGLGVR